MAISAISKTEVEYVFSKSMESYGYTNTQQTNERNSKVETPVTLNTRPNTESKRATITEELRHAAQAISGHKC